MREMLTVFLPKPARNLKRITGICGIEGVERQYGRGVKIQTPTNTEYTFMKNQVLINYSDEQQEEIIKMLNRLIKLQKGVGIKVYNNHLKRKLVQALADERYNIL